MSEELKLLPCPICGKPAVAKTDHMLMEMVYCCGIAAESVSAWNALPRALTWTTEPPKVEGVYMCENNISWDFFSIGKHSYKGGLWAFDMKYGDEYPLSGFKRFSGPIPLPKEG